MANRVAPAAYQSAPYKIFIVHTDGTTNNGGMVVFKWFKESMRSYMFAKAKYQIENYRAKPIKKVLFYDIQDRSKTLAVGGRDEHGTYYGEMEFMNGIKAKA